MKQIFNIDSPVMKKLALLTNFVALNLLWLITSIPIITIGAATAALYNAMIRYIKNKDDTIFKPFFKAFRNNFKQATAIWIPLFLAIALIVLDLIFLIAQTDGFYFLLWIPLVIGIIFTAAVWTYSFAMAGRYKMTVGAILKSSISCFILHPLKSLAMFIMNALPLVLLFAAPYIFCCAAFIWITFWFSLAAYLNTKLLLGIFSKYSAEEAEM